MSNREPQVDFGTIFIKLADLGAKFDKDAYLFPIKASWLVGQRVHPPGERRADTAGGTGCLQSVVKRTHAQLQNWQALWAARVGTCRLWLASAPAPIAAMLPFTELLPFKDLSQTLPPALAGGGA